GGGRETQGGLRWDVKRVGRHERAREREREREVIKVVAPSMLGREGRPTFPPVRVFLECV
ncbi:unnamed protein product, partial [Musa textilis]